MDAPTLFDQLNDYEIIRHILSILWHIDVLLIGFLTLVAVLHTLYWLRGASPLYQHREPVEGWSRRFYPATILLLLLSFTLLFWLSSFRV